MKKKILALCLVVVLVATAITGVTLAYFTDTTQKQTNTFTMGDIEIKLDETDIKNPNGRTDKDQEYGVLMPGISYVKDPTITVKAKSEDCYVFLEIDLNKYVSLINLMGVDAYHNKIGGLEGDYNTVGFVNFVTKLLSDSKLRETVLDRWFVGVDHADWRIMNLEELKEAVAGAPSQTNPDYLNIKLGYIGKLATDNVIKKSDSDTELEFMTNFAMPNTVTEEMFDGDLAYYLPTDTEKKTPKSNFNTESADFKISFTAHAIQANDTSNGINSLETAYAAYFEQN